MTVRLGSVTVYPVKSTAGRDLSAADVVPLGLHDDRRWMVTGADGECLTARRHRALLTIRTTPTADGLRLGMVGQDGSALEVARPSGPSVEVTVHGRALRGIPAAAEASEWIGDVIGCEDVRLVHVDRPRPLNPARSRPGDATAFADAYPVTLASTASLRRLQDWVTETALDRGEDPAAIAMERFRPNLVIDGDLEPFVEDEWASLEVGGVPFDVAKCIDRCVLTTIDPRTLDSGPEPIRTLARHHAWDGATWFGLQLIPRASGTIRVGDPVQPRMRRSPAGVVTG